MNTKGWTLAVMLTFSILIWLWGYATGGGGVTPECTHATVTSTEPQDEPAAAAVPCVPYVDHYTRETRNARCRAGGPFEVVSTGIGFILVCHCPGEVLP